MSRGPFSVSLLTSDPSIEDALEPVKLSEGIRKLSEGIRKGGCDLGSRFAVQTPNLDKPGTSGHIPERASQVPSGLSVVVRTPPTRSLTSGKRQPRIRMSFIATFSFASTR